MNITTKAVNELWTETYRPKTLNDICLPKRIKDMFVNDDIIQNYIFYGHQGTGKTTLARILAKQYNALVINASLENGIDTIRNKVDNFCGLRSLTSKGFKMVYFEEADKMSVDAQEGLRGLIEEYVGTTRFLFTCNNVDKIIAPIMSRLVDINFNFTGEEETEQTRNYAIRMKSIAEANGMTFEKEATIKIFKDHFPDMRSIVQRMENLYRSGKRNVVLSDLKDSGGIQNKDFFNFLIQSPVPTTIYTMVSVYKGREHTLIGDLSQNFTTFVASKPELAPKIGDVAILIHKYSYQIKFVVDPFVTILALCTELSQVLKSK